MSNNNNNNERPVSHARTTEQDIRNDPFLQQSVTAETAAHLAVPATPPHPTTFNANAFPNRPWHTFITWNNPQTLACPPGPWNDWGDTITRQQFCNYLHNNGYPDLYEVMALVERQFVNHFRAPVTPRGFFELQMRPGAGETAVLPVLPHAGLPLGASESTSIELVSAWYQGVSWHQWEPWMGGGGDRRGLLDGSIAQDPNWALFSTDRPVEQYPIEQPDGTNPVSRVGMGAEAAIAGPSERAALSSGPRQALVQPTRSIEEYDREHPPVPGAPRANRRRVPESPRAHPDSIAADFQAYITRQVETIPEASQEGSESEESDCPSRCSVPI